MGPPNFDVTAAWQAFLSADETWQTNPSANHLAKRKRAHLCWEQLFLRSSNLKMKKRRTNACQPNLKVPGLPLFEWADRAGVPLQREELDDLAKFVVPDNSAPTQAVEVDDHVG